MINKKVWEVNSFKEKNGLKRLENSIFTAFKSTCSPY